MTVYTVKTESVQVGISVLRLVPIMAKSVEQRQREYRQPLREQSRYQEFKGKDKIRNVDPGGTVVIILASGSEVRGFDRGFDPGRGRWIFSERKSITSFGREVKPWVPCRRAEIRASEQNLSDFSRSMSEETLLT